MVKICPDCGTEQEDSYKFCNNCGASLDEEAHKVEISEENTDYRSRRIRKRRSGIRTN